MDEMRAINRRAQLFCLITMGIALNVLMVSADDNSFTVPIPHVRPICGFLAGVCLASAFAVWKWGRR
jgi:hypothetical protein